MTGRRLRVASRSLGAAYLLLALWAAGHAESFSSVLADFGPTNEHLVHDFAACAATFGLGLLAGDRWPTWRTPTLALATVWNGLHAVAHVADVQDARPPLLGPVQAALLIAVTAALAWFTRLSVRADRSQGVRR